MEIVDPLAPRQCLARAVRYACRRLVHSSRTFLAKRTSGV